MSEIIGEIASWVALFIVILILYATKLFWDRLNKGFQQSLLGEWYRRRPRNWRVTVSITAVVSLLFLFWCDCGFGIIGAVKGVLWVMVTTPIIGFLILGACFSISEGLEREGLSKQTLKVGIPLIAIGILILLGAILILGILTLSQITVASSIALGTTFFITLFSFMRSDFFSLLRKREKPKSWEVEDRLKGLNEQLSLGHITQEEYERKKKDIARRTSGETTMSEKVLGCMRVTRAPLSTQHREVHEALVITPNRVLVARLGEMPLHDSGGGAYMHACICISRHNHILSEALFPCIAIDAERAEESRFRGIVPSQ